MKERNAFLQNIDILLAKMGRDRVWLSKVSGVKVNTINSIFINNRWPKLDTAAALANGLGVSIKYLLDGEDLDLTASKEDAAILKLVDPLTEEDKHELKGAI